MIEINKQPHLKLVTPQGERLVLSQPAKSPEIELAEWRGALGMLRIIMQKGCERETVEFYSKVCLGRIIALKEKS